MLSFRFGAVGCAMFAGFTPAELSELAQAVSAQLTAHATTLSSGGGEIPHHKTQEPRTMRPVTLRAAVTPQPQHNTFFRHIRPAERVPISDGSEAVLNGRISSCASLVTSVASGRGSPDHGSRRASAHGSRQASARGSCEYASRRACAGLSRGHASPQPSRPLGASASSPALFSFGLTAFDDATVDECLRVDRTSRGRPAGIGERRLDRMTLSDVVRADAMHLVRGVRPSHQQSHQQLHLRNGAQDVARVSTDSAASGGPGEGLTGKRDLHDGASPREENLLLLKQLEKTQLKDGPVFDRMEDRAHRMRRLPGLGVAGAPSPTEERGSGGLESGFEGVPERWGDVGGGRRSRSPSPRPAPAPRHSGGSRAGRPLGRSLGGGSACAGGAARLSRQHVGEGGAGRSHCRAPRDRRASAPAAVHGGACGGAGARGIRDDDGRSNGAYDSVTRDGSPACSTAGRHACLSLGGRQQEEPPCSTDGRQCTHTQSTHLGNSDGAAGCVMNPASERLGLPSLEAGAAAGNGVGRVGCCSGALATSSASRCDAGVAGGASNPSECSAAGDSAGGRLPDAARVRLEVRPPLEMRRSKAGIGSPDLHSRQAATRHGSGWLKMLTCARAMQGGAEGETDEPMSQESAGECSPLRCSEPTHATAGARAGEGGRDGTGMPPLRGGPSVTPVAPVEARIPPDLDTAAVASVRSKLRRRSLAACADHAHAARYAVAAARAAAERAAEASGGGRAGWVDERLPWGDRLTPGSPYGGSSLSTPRSAAGGASDDEDGRETREVVSRALLHARVEQETGLLATAARWRTLRRFSADTALPLCHAGGPHQAQGAGHDTRPPGVAGLGLTAHGMASLAQLGSLAQQRERELESTASLTALSNMYTQACAATGTVPVSRVLAHLGSPWLTLRHYRLGPAGGAALARLLPSVGWRSLILADNFIGESGGAVLSVGLSRNRALTELDLTGNRLGPKAGAMIVAALCPPGGGGGALAAAPIRTLRCGGNAIGDGATETLRTLVAESPHLQV